MHNTKFNLLGQKVSNGVIQKSNILGNLHRYGINMSFPRKMLIDMYTNESSCFNLGMGDASRI